MREKTHTTFEEVLPLLGARIVKGGMNRLCTCPSCGEVKFYFNSESQKGHCMNARCSEVKGSPVSVYMAVTGITDTKEALAQIHGEMQKPNYKPLQATGGEKEQSQLADRDTLNRVYLSMIGKMPLSQAHKVDMLRRGLEPEEVGTLPYGTWSWDEGTGSRILKDAGPVQGVPGFYFDENRGWTLKNLIRKVADKVFQPYRPSILVPYYDWNHRICGIQFRKDREDVAKDEGKYMWLSSSNKNMGTSANQTVHFACDWTTDFRTGSKKPILQDRVLLTEGAMKADISHIVTGEPIIAIAGVQAMRGLPDALRYLKSAGVNTIVDAFDMDYLTNENVQAAMVKLREIVASAGLKYERRNWNPKYKGYDDYVVARRKGEVE